MIDAKKYFLSQYQNSYISLILMIPRPESVFSAMTLKETFEKAVADSKQLTNRPDNNTLLQLYSLYKQATEGDSTGDGPSNPFDFIAKAKHDAWAKLKGTSTDQAMTEYIRIIEGLQAGK